MLISHGLDVLVLLLSKVFEAVLQVTDLRLCDVEIISCQRKVWLALIQLLCQIANGVSQPHILFCELFDPFLSSKVICFKSVVWCNYLGILTSHLVDLNCQVINVLPKSCILIHHQICFLLELDLKLLYIAFRYSECVLKLWDVES